MLAPSAVQMAPKSRCQKVDSTASISNNAFFPFFGYFAVKEIEVFEMDAKRKTVQILSETIQNKITAMVRQDSTGPCSIQNTRQRQS
jgi:hypothetical protein